MTITPKAGAYAGTALLWLLAGILSGAPALVLLAAPFAGAVIAAALLPPQWRGTPRAHLDRARVLEGATVDLVIDGVPTRAGSEFGARISLPDGLRLGASKRNGQSSLSLQVVCERWGGYTVQPPSVTLTDATGVWRRKITPTPDLALRVYPAATAARSTVPPHHTQMRSGNEVARAVASGIEFADVRPLLPGDRVRDINWRVTARRGSVHVNRQHPERNADVVLWLDAFVSPGLWGQRTLDMEVRAAGALAGAYLRRHDRVGVVSFGGLLRWLRPGMGRRQAYLIAESLIDTQVVFSYAWKDIASMPRGVLPPQASVMALSPLLDVRSVSALGELQARGFDVAVIRMNAAARFAPGGSFDTAVRLWRLARELPRTQLTRQGIAVAEWDGESPLDSALQELRSFRKRTWHASA